MKKAFLLLVATLVVFGCKNVDDRILVPTSDNVITLTATIDASSRLAIKQTSETVFEHYWQSEDQIVVFDGAGNSAALGLNGYDSNNPSNTAVFSGEFAHQVAGAVYPANNSGAAFDGDKFSVTFPAEQTYAADTYDPASNVYVATSSGSTLSFISLMCYVRIALWSENATTVNHIIISSLDGGKISGAAKVSKVGAIGLLPSGSDSIRLNCGDLTISNDREHPTYFYVAVPAVVISGLKIDVYTGEGASETHLFRNVTKTPVANKVFMMGTLQFSPLEAGSVALLEVGGSFNMDIKKQADPSGNYPTAYTDCDKITRIIFEVNKNMTGIEGKDVSSAGDKSIIATFKDGIIRVQTAADIIRLNPSSTSLFRKMSCLTTIDGMENLRYVPVSGGDWQFMFRDDAALVSLDLSKINITNGSYGTKTRQMFLNCSALESISLPSANNKLIAADAREMFSGCESLEVINDLCSGNTCTATDSMFCNCESLQRANLTNVKTHNVVTAKLMFYRCTSLEEIVFGTNSTFAACTTMTRMFDSCLALPSIDLSGFNTSNLTDMSYMFKECEDLTELDLSGFDTRKVTTMAYLCNSCDNLKIVNLSGENCSTQSMSSSQALMGLIMNTKNVHSLFLGDQFSLASTRFSAGIDCKMLPVLTSSSIDTLTIFANNTIATDVLQQVGRPTEEYRAVNGVKSEKLLFKSLDGAITWKYYSSNNYSTTPLLPAEVTKASFVGLGGSSWSDKVSDIGLYNTDGDYPSFIHSFEEFTDQYSYKTGSGLYSFTIQGLKKGKLSRFTTSASSNLDGGSNFDATLYTIHGTSGAVSSSGTWHVVKSDGLKRWVEKNDGKLGFVLLKMED